MNEEEKKTIEDINGLITIFETDNGKDFEATCLAQKEIALNLKTILNLIEKLQKENEDLKAKLEYKEYGDLDNTEFEKYINEIVETRTKELREQLEEEQELNKIIKETRINKILENNIEVKKLREENENLRKELNAENKRCMMLAIEKQDYFEKYRYHLQQNERLTKEFSNVILVQKVKDMIRHYQELQDNYIKKYDEINEGLQAMINALQELIEEREEK